MIKAVIRLISDIAARTNLLALNATIETARRGRRRGLRGRCYRGRCGVRWHQRLAADDGRDLQRRAAADEGQAVLDVLSESVNNPVRFLLGWFAITGGVVPPGSVLLAYWMGAPSLMGTKRYSEYRRIGDQQEAGLYRRSFQYYTKSFLLRSSFFYALCSAFLIGVFLIKYKIELLLSFPFFAVLFTWYLAISLKSDSAAQARRNSIGKAPSCCSPHSRSPWLWRCSLLTYRG